jgi:hypothetical protein
MHARTWQYMRSRQGTVPTCVRVGDAFTSDQGLPMSSRHDKDILVVANIFLFEYVFYFLSQQRLDPFQIGWPSLIFSLQNRRTLNVSRPATRNLKPRKYVLSKIDKWHCTNHCTKCPWLESWSKREEKKQQSERWWRKGTREREREREMVRP